MVVDGAAAFDADTVRDFDRVDVCAEENKFPAAIFFALDEMLNFAVAEFAACVFVAVSDDYEQSFLRAVFFAGVLHLNQKYTSAPKFFCQLA